MPSIFLLDRDRDKIMSMLLNADDAGYTGRLELLQQDAAREANRMMRRAGPLRRHVQENRIVPVINRFNANHGLFIACR